MGVVNKNIDGPTYSTLDTEPKITYQDTDSS